MKPAILTALFSITVHFLSAQDFPGFRAGNFTGVNGAFFNPASIADSRYRFDFNLVSASSFVGNNKASFKIKNLTQSFDTEEWEDKVFGSQAGPSNGLLSVDVHGPSLMVNVGSKTAIALTSRVRAMANIIDMDGELAGQLLDESSGTSSFPYTINSDEDMQVAVNGWAELGISYARVLKVAGPHFLKGGATVKYLSGAANGYIQIEQLKGTLNEDALQEVYLSNTTGSIKTAFGGLPVSDLEASDFLNPDNTGLGMDIGFVYEFRPAYETFEMDESDDLMRNRNKYKYRLAIALLDIGGIRYNKNADLSGGYNIHITGADRLYLHELSEVAIDEYNTYFKSKPQYFTPLPSNGQNTYRASLPTTLQLDVDYHLHKGFYAQLAAQFPLNARHAFNNRYQSGFTLTPRYEGRAVGLYLPLNYNSLTQFNAGISLRLGPLFVGSGSLLTAALGQSKQADVHVGIHLAGLHKDQQKKAKKNKK